MTESPDGTERRSPLDGVHVAAGASFTDFAGWRMPVRYSSELAEHHAVRTAAGLFDLSHMAEIVVIGPEAAAALDYALAGRLSALVDGQAKYSLLLAEDGGTIDDVVVYRTGSDRFLVVANAGNRGPAAEALRDRAAGFDCVVEDESDDVALIALQGPRAEEILRGVDGFDIPELDGLRYYRATTGDFRGHEVLVARTGYTGEDGFEFYLAPEAATSLWEAIAETGAGSGLVPAGLAARDTLRLEAGMPLYGNELTRSTQPAQLGLGRVVVLDKDGGFVGREAVAAGPADDAPVLVGLASEGRRAGRTGYPVVADADGTEAVGAVTSGALSPTLGHPIAMALVRPDLAAPGTSLYIDVRGTRLAATVVPLPFYSRKKS
ncbi:glycine cleavage system aminomethyltransferase GcvT [Homoserinibacter sp. GY 40078]|uniref:glycine cleavage system aminomethyltransferase GcvT n=1 Tax=Homoserinibacter sp. GY 40078 TaxID=2603275 RepID=UPI0011C93DDE|nr:glycine cleavage system aminomethyltransferase GcvT [Homoserinibacter sp. GY 40078]TXK19585.1 glycine cleavage system aminomethyltransferase GcvT [Homoserinibacter sp. GY 40078]